MKIIGQIPGNCAGATPLTGRGNCDKKEGKTIALILTELNSFYPTDPAEFIAGLNGWILAGTSPRMFPIKGVVAGALNGGDIATAELGTYGGSTPIGINQLNIAYQFDAGDCFYKELFKVRKRKMRLFRVDDEGYVYGTIVTREGEDHFAGFEVTLMPLYTLTDGTAETTIGLTAYFSVNYEFELAAKNGINVGLNSIPDGLIGIVLQASSKASGAKVVTVCSGEDITAEYGEDWTTELFLNNSGGKPTTVTFAKETGMLTIAPAGNYRVVGAEVLAEANIIGYEGVDTYTAITSE